MNGADLIQGSDQWLLARCGSLGASKVRDAFATLKKGERAKASEDLMYEIAAERITRIPARRVNALQWGSDHEAEARQAYSFLTNAPVAEVGLIPHPTIANAHASPDALVGEDGGLEVKCPTSATHLRTLLGDDVPEEHLPQIYWSMACTGRAWWDFMSFDPRFPEGMQFFIRRVERHQKIIESMEANARAFLAELEDKLKALEERYPVEA